MLGCILRVTVQLYHARAPITVQYVARHSDTRIHRGALVSIIWIGQPWMYLAGQPAKVARLVVAEKPAAAVNLFETIPPGWCPDPELVKAAADLWASLPEGYRQLINAVFWDDRRFHRFVTGPSSLAGHHDGRNGNFRHSIDVAQICEAMAAGSSVANRAVLATAALLHDAGKADEYECVPSGRHFRMTTRGALLGHRETLVEWLAVARGHGHDRVVIPQTHYLALLHALTAGRGAEWLGIRTSVSIEAEILAAADRISGSTDLMRRCAVNDPGFGVYHKHLSGRAYVVGVESDAAVPPSVTSGKMELYEADVEAALRRGVTQTGRSLTAISPRIPVSQAWPRCLRGG